MHDQPEPTREEEEQAQEHQDEHEAMRYPGHENPPAAQPPVRESGPVEGDRGNREVPPRTSDTQDDEEIHDA